MVYIKTMPVKTDQPWVFVFEGPTLPDESARLVLEKHLRFGGSVPSQDPRAETVGAGNDPAVVPRGLVQFQVPDHRWRQCCLDLPPRTTPGHHPESRGSSIVSKISTIHQSHNRYRPHSPKKSCYHYTITTIRFRVGH